MKLLTRIGLLVMLLSSPVEAHGRVNLEFNVEIGKRRSWCDEHPWKCYHEDEYREWRRHRDWDEYRRHRDCRYDEYERRWYHRHRHHHHRH